MATKRRPTSSKSTGAADSNQVFSDDTDNIIPGEVLLTLTDTACADMTASVPLHPSGPMASESNNLGVSDVDGVLAALGAYDITRLALPLTGAASEAARGLEHRPEQKLGRTFRVRVAADTDIEAAITRLTKVSSVEMAEPNRYREASVVPNDTRFVDQWGLTKINAPAAWDVTQGSSAAVVAVIDSGVDLSHPELAPLLVPGFDMVDLGPNPTSPGLRFEGDFSGRDPIPDDEVGHGTHVAGTIAAVSNNAAGVAGVTWNCRIMPVKALTRAVRLSNNRVTGVGASADIAAAIRWAADNGASIINMSLGSSASTTVEETAVAYAVSKGCVVIAAMGNDGTSNPSFPAAFPDVVAVGAIDSAEALASFSQTGPHIDVVGPGVDIWSTDLAGGFSSKSGTSMATPHVAGVAALIRSVKPTATVAEVVDILRTTAKPLRVNAGDPVPNDSFGWGLVDAAAAVTAAQGPIFPLTPGIRCFPPTPTQPCVPISPRITCLPQTPVLPCAPPTPDCVPLTPQCPPTPLGPWCPPQTPDCVPLTPQCPPTPFGPWCPPITLKFRGCFPETPFCPPPTRLIKDCFPQTVIQPDCFPQSVKILCEPVSPFCGEFPTTPTTPLTGGGPIGPGPIGGGQGYDPYGYFGGQGQGYGQQGQAPQGEGTYADGYAAGYAAAIQQMQGHMQGQMGGQMGEAQGPWDNYVLKPYPITWSWRSCIPHTIVHPECIPIPTPPWTRTPTIWQGPIQGPIQGPGGGFGQGYDPYGQTPFQG